MSFQLLYRLAAIALMVGGILGLSAHLLHPMPPGDPVQLANYAHRSAPAHLLLLIGVALVLIGLPAILLRHLRRLGPLCIMAFPLLFLGLLFAEFLHCTLEISLIPLLINSVPYAALSLVETAYSHTPLATLQALGQVFYFIGVPLLAIGLMRAKAFRGWAIFPLCLTTALNFASFVPGLSRVTQGFFPVSFYASIVILGIALLADVQQNIAIRSAKFSGAVALPGN